MSSAELALSFNSYPALKRWQRNGDIGRVPLARILGEDNPLTARFADAKLAFIYFGNEFCEFLVPAAEPLKRAVELAEKAGARFSLLTPIACDRVLDQLMELLPLLPPDAEMIVSDWGVARMARREFPSLRLAAGRLLCKMIKDPRLDSAVWADLYPHGLGGLAFQRMLERLAIDRIEVDVPPYAVADVFANLSKPAAVHAPFACVSKGRMCKIGSLALPQTEKFSSGRECRRECLTYIAAIRRPERDKDLETRQHGNSLFYRHTGAMAGAVGEAFTRGWLSRLVIPGE